MLLRKDLKMDVAAFQSLYPEEVQVHLGRGTWFGSSLQYYNAEDEDWSNLASGGEAMMFCGEAMTFEIIEGLVKSSIVSGKKFVIIVDGSLLGFVRGKDLQEENEEMDIEIDWDMDNSTNSGNYEMPDMFSPEEDLKRLL